MELNMLNPLMYTLATISSKFHSSNVGIKRAHLVSASVSQRPTMVLTAFRLAAAVAHLLQLVAIATSDTIAVSHNMGGGSAFHKCRGCDVVRNPLQRPMPEDVLMLYSPPTEQDMRPPRHLGPAQAGRSYLSPAEEKRRYLAARYFRPSRQTDPSSLPLIGLKKSSLDLARLRRNRGQSVGRKRNRDNSIHPFMAIKDVCLKRCHSSDFVKTIWDSFKREFLSKYVNRPAETSTWSG
jgi:hypothetical protein